MLIFSSCATIPRLPKDLDTAAKTFSTIPDKANVYIIRDEFLGAAVNMELDINGQLIGRTTAKTYILTSVKPGTLNIVSHAENDSSISIEAEAGKNYFLWQEVKIGAFLPRTKLHIIDEADAKERILKCERVGFAP